MNKFSFPVQLHIPKTSYQFAMQRYSQDPHNHLRWRTLQQLLTVFSRELFSQSFDVCGGPNYTSALPQKMFWGPIIPQKYYWSILFIPPENIRKPLKFWCFSGVLKETSGMKCFKVILQRWNPWNLEPTNSGIKWV